MELLLDNLRNVFFKGKHGKVREITLPDKKFLFNIALTLSLSFLVARVAFNNSIEATSIAFLTVLMARSRANIYALPFICVGMLSTIRTSFGFPGDGVALLVCTFVFILPFVRKYPLTLRALIAGAVMVSVKVVYHFISGFLFLYDGKILSMDLLVLFGAVYIFHTFFNILDKGVLTGRNPIESVLSISVVILLAVGGLGISTVYPVSILHISAFLIALVAGYGMGPGTGGLAGIVSGFVIMLMAYETPALAGILGCCGAIAGFFSGKPRLVTGVSFAGLALTFGMLKGFPDLYISIYEPIIAAAVFMLVPTVMMDNVMRALSILRGDDSHYELDIRRNAKDQIREYANLFSKLALSSGGVGAYYPSRDIVTQQFKGMSKALEKMASEVSEYKALQTVKPRYSLKTATSSYAKEGKISGDSCLCAPVNRHEYLLALSDGMGQGIRAAEESSFTVTTLFNLVKAGFEVELALRMVNSILLQKSNDEILSTLDMGFINLYTGKAKIFKIGAAAGFIKRGDNVKTVKMSALPLGIIERVPVESISVQLKKGDMLIIVSDGVTEAERGCNGPDWVRDVVAEIKSKDPRTMADLIINNSVQKYGLREKDDMTVMVALIE